jgi:hypothetical protein
MTEDQWTNVYAPIVTILSPGVVAGLWEWIGWQPHWKDGIMVAAFMAMATFDGFMWGYTKGKERATTPPRTGG